MRNAGAPTRRTTPAQLLAVGIVAAMAAGVLGFAWRLDMADPNDLHQVVGQVEDVSHSGGGKSPRAIQILLRDGTRIHRLAQDDPGDAAPTVRTIRVGDFLVAMVKPDLLGRDMERVWAIRRGDEQLLSYTETLHLMLTKAERSQRIAFVLGALAVLLSGGAFVLRVRHGAWC
jgi:hypothetical protein